MICIPGIISELTRQIASRRRLLRREAKPKDLDWRECCKLKIKRQTWWPLQISEVASKNPGFWIPSKIRRQVMVEMKIVSDPLVLCSFLVWFRVSFCDCSRLMISATHRLTSEPVLESSTPEFVIFYNLQFTVYIRSTKAMIASIWPLWPLMTRWPLQTNRYPWSSRHFVT